MKDLYKKVLEPQIDSDYINYIEDELVLEENQDQDEDVEIRSCCVRGTSFINIDVEFLGTKVYSKIFNKPQKGKVNFRAVCDGAFLSRRNDQWYLIVVELKNSLTSRTFEKASKQLASTAIKAKYFLDFFGIEDPSKVLTIGFIVSQVKDKTIEKQLVSSKATVIGKHRPDILCRELVRKRKCTIKEEDCFFSNRFIFNKRYQLSDFPIKYIEGDNKTISIIDFFD
jgi:hypothetical protein